MAARRRRGPGRKVTVRQRLVSLARTLNVAQRVVVSVGWGVALMALGVTTETWRSSGIEGWFAYAPVGGSFPGAPFLARHPGLRLLLWLALTGLWAAVSVWLFGVHESDHTDGNE